jgi:hypothetical protein
MPAALERDRRPFFQRELLSMLDFGLFENGEDAKNVERTESDTIRSLT